MIIADNIFAMLLTHEKFKEFSHNAICDTTQATEVLVCLSCENRAEVEALIAMATTEGGTTFKPAQDYGFMYGHAYRDLDGHIWELMWMDPNFIQK